MPHVIQPWNFPQHEYAQRDHGPTFCPECEAVHANKRWFFEPDRLSTMKAEGLEPHQCPGCRMVDEGLYEGQLLLNWAGLDEEGIARTDLLNLLDNEVAREKEKNPLSQVVFMEHRGPEVEVLTTTEFLATRLGHAVERAFHGELRITRPEREKFVRVHWSRD